MVVGERRAIWMLGLQFRLAGILNLGSIEKWEDIVLVVP